MRLESQSRLLEVRGLCIKLRSGKTLVDGLSFELDRGSALGLAGESGSGKSLTALALMGLLDARQFEVEAEQLLFYSGRVGTASPVSLLPSPGHGDPMAPLRGKSIAMIFQEPLTALNPVLRCGVQLEECLVLHQPEWTSARRRLEMVKALEEVQLSEADRILSSYPHQLSGGQRQRVMIAMALSGNPDLLIADEPTTALDVEVQAGLVSLLQQLCRSRKLALLFISHDLPLMSALVDRVALMHRGRLLESGPCPQVWNSPQFPHVAALLAARPSRGLPGRDPAPAPGDRLLEARNLGWKTPKGNWAVADVTLDVFARTSLAVVGASGSGKSSLARMLAGLVPPDRGHLRMEGRDLWVHGSWRGTPNDRLNLHLVFQDPYSSLNPAHSVRQMLGWALGQRHPEWSSSRRMEAMAYWLQKVRLEPASVLDRRPAAFSGGQRQRLVLARALCLEPRVLLCDESVAALDGTVQAQILDLLRHLQEELGFGMVFVTHDLEVAGTLCDSVLVMQAGSVVESGPTSSVLHAPKTDYTSRLLSSIPRLHAQQATYPS
jgi:peptide/nickel transport system ATP-binding protein